MHTDINRLHFGMIDHDSIDAIYSRIYTKVITEGYLQDNRTGVKAYTIPFYSFEYDMKNGFPLLTTKHVSFKNVASELEFFIKGITSKKWLQDRGNHIWDAWGRRSIAPYGTDEESKRNMRTEDSIGPAYGFQWRHFGADYEDWNGSKRFCVQPYGGVDQLWKLVNLLKKDPNSRRMIVSAWNPEDLDDMALTPCHLLWQVSVINNKLNLIFQMRSSDVGLGLPYNIASYALLLHLLTKESGYEEGKLIASLSNVHIYENHVEPLKEQMRRIPFGSPGISTSEFKSIFDWEYTDTVLENYKKHPAIKMDVAV